VREQAELPPPPERLAAAATGGGEVGVPGQRRGIASRVAWESDAGGGGGVASSGAGRATQGERLVLNILCPLSNTKVDCQYLSMFFKKVLSTLYLIEHLESGDAMARYILWPLSNTKVDCQYLFMFFKKVLSTIYLIEHLESGDAMARSVPNYCLCTRGRRHVKLAWCPCTMVNQKNYH
jgi:hypothetical protein